MATCNYSYSISHTTRTITSLYDLKPGNHIRVNGDLTDCNSGISFYSHHMLVVKVVNDSTIRVIHKTSERGAVEEVMSCSPEQITLLDYDCAYTGQEAIRRAREHIGEEYSLLWSNCEHFVTEVRTGTDQSRQIQTAALVFGVAAAAVTGLTGLTAYWWNRKSIKKTDPDKDPN